MSKKDYSKQNKEFIDAYEVKNDGSLADQFMANIKCVLKERDSLTPLELNEQRVHYELKMRDIIIGALSHPDCDAVFPVLTHLRPKPLFIPLCAKYYDAFVDGNKDTEYRILGPRWNEKTCFQTREVVLSRGYGKQNRCTGNIKAVRILNAYELSSALQKSMYEIYRLTMHDTRRVIAIEIRDITPIRKD